MRVLSLSAALAVTAMWCHVAGATAQEWRVDVAANSVGYDTTGHSASLSVAPLVEWNEQHVYATLSAALVGFQSGSWTSQGRGDLSLLSSPLPGLRPLRGEVVASAEGSVYSGGYRTAGTRGEMRLHLARPSGGLWAGGTATTGWTSGSTTIATAVGPTVGAWGRQGRWTGSALWSPFRLEGAWYQQLEGRVSGSAGVVDLTGNIGWRRAPAGSDVPNATWGGGTAAVWFTSQTAVVLSAGAYASDLLQALPRGRYVSLGIRFSRRRPSIWAGSLPGRAVYTHERGESELRFRVPGASRVALAGDWTGWRPVPMQRGSDGKWSLRVNLSPGVHRFNLLVDGTRWIVPEGIGSVDDGFGGKTSLLVVPE